MVGIWPNRIRQIKKQFLIRIAHNADSKIVFIANTQTECQIKQFVITVCFIVTRHIIFL